MSVQVFEFPSRSSDAVHKVTVGANNHLHCTCVGFQSPSKCWHVRDVAEKLGLPHNAMSTTPALPWGSPTGRLTKTEPEIQTLNRTQRQPLPSNVIEHDFASIEKAVYDKHAAAGEMASANAWREHLTNNVIASGEAPFIEPMLGRQLKETERIEHWEGQAAWTLEEKYDGHRMQVYMDPQRIPHFRSRSENVRDVSRHLINSLSLLPPGLYDAELYIPGKTHTDVTRKDLVHKQKLVLFDILMVWDPDSGYHSAVSKPLHERRELLNFAMSQMTGVDVFVSPVVPVKKEYLDMVWARGGEGVMLKNIYETYQPGCRRWIKFKKEDSTTVTITGFKAAKLGPCSIILAKDDHGIEVRCKTLDTKMRKQFEAAPDSFVGRRLVIAYTAKTVGKQKYQHPRAEYLED